MGHYFLDILYMYYSVAVELHKKNLKICIEKCICEKNLLIYDKREKYEHINECIRIKLRNTKPLKRDFFCGFSLWLIEVSELVFMWARKWNIVLRYFKNAQQKII